MELKNFIRSIYVFYQRQWKFISFFLIVGFLLGFSYNYLKAPYYESSAIATSGLSYFEGIIDPSELEFPIIDQKIAVDIINSLGEIIDSEEYELFANAIGVSLEVAKSVLLLEAEQLYDLDLENRRQKQSQFQITIRVSDNKSIRSLQDGLVTYFNNNLYSNKNYNLFLRQTPALISYLEKEINDIKEYKTQLKNKSSVEMSTVSIANDDSELMQNELVYLFDRKQKLERELELYKPISFVSNFPVYNKSENRLIIRLSLFVFIFFLGGMFFGLIREIKTNLL